MNNSGRINTNGQTNLSIFGVAAKQRFDKHEKKENLVEIQKYKRIIVTPCHPSSTRKHFLSLVVCTDESFYNIFRVSTKWLKILMNEKTKSQTYHSLCPNLPARNHSLPLVIVNPAQYLVRF